MNNPPEDDSWPQENDWPSLGDPADPRWDDANAPLPPLSPLDAAPTLPPQPLMQGAGSGAPPDPWDADQTVPPATPAPLVPPPLPPPPFTPSANRQRHALPPRPATPWAAPPAVTGGDTLLPPPRTSGGRPTRGVLVVLGSLSLVALLVVGCMSVLFAAQIGQFFGSPSRTGSTSGNGGIVVAGPTATPTQDIAGYNATQTAAASSDTPTATPSPVSTATATPFPPELSVSPQKMRNALCSKGAYPLITVRNIGGQTLNWSAATSVPGRVKPIPASGSVDPGGSQLVALTGDYSNAKDPSFFVNFSSNGGSAQVTVFCTFLPVASPTS